MLPILAIMMYWVLGHMLPILANMIYWILGHFNLRLPGIILEDGVVTKLEWQLETRFVSEEELGTEKVVPVWTTGSQRGMCMLIQNSVSLDNLI